MLIKVLHVKFGIKAYINVLILVYPLSDVLE